VEVEYMHLVGFKCSKTVPQALAEVGRRMREFLASKSAHVISLAREELCVHLDTKTGKQRQWLAHA
jgi:hypothetical protein